jgi:hypothetical protein
VVRGVAGRAKNLIFASRGPKPEIGFADAINNDIVVLSGEESCLIYDRSIGSNGLLWSDLVAWWSGLVPGGNAAGLGARLQQSLSSDGEKNLFGTYFKKYRSALGEGLPALLPQFIFTTTLPSSKPCATVYRSRASAWIFSSSFRAVSGLSSRSTVSITFPKTPNPR